MPNYYDPFKELQQLVNQTMGQAKTLAMPMDLYSKDDTYVAEIDLPGVDPASIDIDVEDRSITIRAERRAHRREDGVTWVSRERAAGTYARQITVGTGLALDQITGEYNDGVLTLTIPVAEQSKPRKIQVTRGSGSRTIEGQTAESKSETSSTQVDGGAAEQVETEGNSSVEAES